MSIAQLTGQITASCTDRQVFQGTGCAEWRVLVEANGPPAQTPGIAEV
jgi:hypothetical protein